MSPITELKTPAGTATARPETRGPCRVGEALESAEKLASSPYP